MFTALFDRLGNWNPQLMRELKGRLHPRNIIAAIALSVLSQLILLLFFGTQLPPTFNPHEHLKLTTKPSIDFIFGTSNLPDYPPYLRIQSINDNIEEVYRGGQILAAADYPRTGDRILAIDGQPVETFADDFNDFNKATEAIQGQRSTTVSLANDPILGQDAVLSIDRHGVGKMTLRLPRVAVTDTYSPYCKFDQRFNTVQAGSRSHPYDPKFCSLNADKTAFEVDWRLWYQQIFKQSSLMLTVGLLTLGSLMLMQNLEREQRRGTLTFIRLSPRSSLNILSGQILGAPVVIYLAAALMLPLQVFSAFRAGIPLIELLAFYGLLGVTGLLFFSLSLLLGLISKGLGGLQAWLVAAGIFLLQMVMGVAVSGGSLGEPFVLHWAVLFSPVSVLHYLLDIASDPNRSVFQFAGYKLKLLSFVALFAVHGLVWILWLWHALRRKFGNPQQVPLIERRYSYLLTACFEVFLLGFASSSRYQDNVTIVGFLNLLFLTLLISALQPSRQSLEDWVRFRLSQRRSQRQSLLKDLIQGESSPAILAIAINVAIALGMMAVWAIRAHLTTSLVNAVLTYGALGSLILIYASINQVWFLSKVKRPEIWSLGTLFVAFAAPLLVRSLLIDVSSSRFVQLLEAAAVPWMMGSSAGFYAGAILSQWLLLCLLNFTAMRQLQKAGESASKRLFSGPAALSARSS
ncbi:MAG: hypothetical protein HC816_03785 [Leptolyngbyaceae cyanobacterium RM1_1_2]|nr:hypothetical protein [Leptolyngbyaceae cyanobacterium RM1_1_2]